MNQAVAIAAKRGDKRLSKYALLRRLVMFESASLFSRARERVRIDSIAVKIATTKVT